MAETAVTAETVDRRNALDGFDVLRHAAAADAFGHRIHIALAMAWAFFVPLVMIPWAKDVALILLVGWSLARVLFGSVRYAWGPLFRMPLAWLITAWLVWTGLSILWSPAPVWGLDEYKAFRAFLIPILVFPVLFEFRKMLWAFLAGAAIVTVIQLLQVSDLAGLPRDSYSRRSMDRFCAWIAPNPGGLLLAGAFVAHAAWLLAERRGRMAGVHVAGAVLAAIGVLFMNNRGAFVASGIGAALVCMVVVILLPSVRAKVLLVATSIVFGLTCGLYVDEMILGSKISAPIEQRIQRGLDDLKGTAEFEKRPLVSRSLTYRLEVWSALLDDIQDRPLLGTGMGGLWHAFDDHPEFISNDRTGKSKKHKPAYNNHKHGHNSWLFVPATTGLIGMALMWGTLGTAIAGLCRRARRHPEAIVSFGILVVWMIGNVFDSLLLSGSTSCLLIIGLLAAFVPQVGAEP
ncbi:MAG: O-antigen ligase family protein [Phycisphaerales bacterium]|nr:O-antigen ligase family protein [Phycisphaerales bacterium]